MNWKYASYHLFWNMLDLLFPPVCGGCDKPGHRWCVDCQNRVNVLNGILCEICGLPQDKPGVCETCLAERPHFRALRAWAVFSDPIQPALHRLKYRRDVSMGDMLASEMTPFVKGLNWQIDLVIPIPLGRQRLRERGYNQVGMIARPLALALGMRYAPNGLMRRKETRSQVGLTRVERKANVQHAFQAGAGVNGKAVLIMDDVSTTGSTLSAGAAALYSAGARDVYALTVARALPQQGLMHV
ncbi:MAG: ComF family protein [Chloroflexota bacterium]